MSKQSPYFTIIIPTLNEEAYLPNLLRSLSAQRFKDFEVMVVDGKSKDKTTAIARKEGIRVISSDKKGVSHQRNLGAENAKGEYLIFIDADCKVSPAFLTKAFRATHKQKGLIFISPMKSENTDPEVGAFISVCNKIAELSLQTNKPMPTSGLLMIEKYFFKRIGGYDESVFIGEDVKIVQKSVQWGVRPRFMDRNHVIMSMRRVHKEGKMKSLSKVLFSSAYILLKGDIKKKIFNYEMGGHRYFKVPATQSKHLKQSRTK